MARIKDDAYVSSSLQFVDTVGRQTTLFGRVCQGGGTGGEVCRLLLYLVDKMIIQPRSVSEP